MALNSRHMENYDEELKRMLEQTQRMRATSYDNRTTCGVHSPTRDTTSSPPRKTDTEIKNERLTTENQKLKNQYADLLQKANKLVAAYRELQTENEALVQKNQVLTLKKMKKESLTKGFAGLGKSIRKGYDKIILWFNT